MDVAPWIRVFGAILDTFAIWVRSETCQENVVLIFLAYNVKYKGENNLSGNSSTVYCRECVDKYGIDNNILSIRSG